MTSDAYEARLARELLYGILTRCPTEGTVPECQNCEMRGGALELSRRWVSNHQAVDYLAIARKHRLCTERERSRKKSA